MGKYVKKSGVVDRPTLCHQRLDPPIRLWTCVDDEVCVFLSAGDCVRPRPFVNGQVKPLDYNNCTVRCWGYGYKGTDNLPQDHLEANYYTQGQDNQDTYRTKDGDSQVATDV